MGIFGGKKNKDEIVLVLDIGSGSVGGAIVSLPSKNRSQKEPIILAQKRTLMKYQDEIDFDKFAFYMKKALYETTHELLLQKAGKPDKIYCFLGSPWYVSETRNVHIEKKEKFTTSKKMIDAVIDKELRSVIKEYEKKYDRGNDVPKLMENIILESLVNGYKVSDVFDKKALSLDLIMYLSVTPQSIMDGIKDTVKRVFPHSRIYFGSFIMALFNAIRIKHPKLEAHLLIDINAEITDVGMVTDGILTSFFSFPIGRNYIIRAIMKKNRVNKDQAESLFGLYTRGDMQESTKLEFKKIMDQVEKDWKNVFYRSIVEISKISGYTDVVHLVSHKDTSVFFSNILANPNVPLAILGDRKFSVDTISGEDLKNLCRVKNGPCDEFLMSEALCASSFNSL